MDNLRDLIAMDESVFPYPYMMDMLKRLTELPQFAHIQQTAASRADGYKTTDSNIYKANPLDGPATFSKYDGKGPLVVRVFSFSFRKVFQRMRAAMEEDMFSTAVALITLDAMNHIRS